ncbi:unnamed protein product, partial [Polarella glacialis]
RRPDLALDVTYAGQFYLCQVLKGVPSAQGGPGRNSEGVDPCAEDAVTAFIRPFLQGGGEGSSERSDVVALADELHEALLKDAGPKSPSSLYVCVDQVLFCWLLRRRSRRPLASPMVILLGMSFMEDVPLNWRDEVAADVFIWFSPSWTWSSFQVDKASEPLQDLLWTQHQHIVLQTFWQFGLKVPWFDLPGLSFWSGAKHNPPHSNTRPSLIVLRSAFWRLPAGNVLRSLVRHLFVNEDVHWMESFLG